MRISDDSAIAPVVAMMLILAAIVTLLSIYNSGYMPQLKEEAEISHLEGVGSSFKEYVTYIENSAREKKEGTVSIPVKLGGGDIFLSKTKSGGVLSVSDNTNIVNVSSDESVGSMNGTICSLEYETIGNFWHERGYSWDYGIVNITEYSQKSPLNYAGMGEACDYIENQSGFPDSFVDVDFNGGYIPILDEDGNFTGFSHYNCTGIDVDILRIQGDPDILYASGNGDSRISINTKVSEPMPLNGTCLNFTAVYLGGEGSYLKRSMLRDIWSDLSNINSKNFYNVGGIDRGYDWCSIESRDDPLNIRVRFVNVTVGVR